jgi:hypothetical protein
LKSLVFIKLNSQYYAVFYDADKRGLIFWGKKSKVRIWDGIYSPVNGDGNPIVKGAAKYHI